MQYTMAVVDMAVAMSIGNGNRHGQFQFSTVPLPHGHVCTHTFSRPTVAAQPVATHPNPSEPIRPAGPTGPNPSCTHSVPTQHTTGNLPVGLTLLGPMLTDRLTTIVHGIGARFKHCLHFVTAIGLPTVRIVYNYL